MRVTAATHSAMSHDTAIAPSIDRDVPAVRPIGRDRLTVEATYR